LNTSLVHTGTNGGDSFFSTVVAKLDLTARTNNVPGFTLYSVPSGGAGLYRVDCHVVLTIAAGTSSKLPACFVGWFDEDTNHQITCGAGGPQLSNGTLTANTVGTTGNLGTGWSESTIIRSAASQAVTICTTGYASTPANAMQFAVHAKIEFLGP